MLTLTSAGAPLSKSSISLSFSFLLCKPEARELQSTRTILGLKTLTYRDSEERKI